MYEALRQFNSDDQGFTVLVGAITAVVEAAETLHPSHRSGAYWNLRKRSVLVDGSEFHEGEVGLRGARLHVMGDS